MQDALVRRAQDGDIEAFAVLAEAIEPTLRRFCSRLAGDGRAGCAPDDLFQETLVRALRAVGNLQRPERFEAWLLAIAANLARTWWLRQQRWPISLERLAQTYPDIPWDSLGTQVDSPEQVYEEAEQIHLLQAALASLPPALAQVITLHYLQGLNYQEIAAALAVPVSTVKGRLFKSRRRLRADLLAAGFGAPGVPAAPCMSAQSGAPTTPFAQTSLLAQAIPPERPAQPDRPSTSREGKDTMTTQEALEEVTIESIRMNRLAPNRVVFLKATKRERFMPVIIGVAEADAISLTLQGVSTPRPMTHDLLLSGFSALGARVTRVVMHDYVAETKTFLAQVHLEQTGQDGAQTRTTILDSRPSDGFALAVRAGVPIFVATAVLDACGMDASKDPPDAETEAPAAP
jgi:uncharacterized protein